MNTSEAASELPIVAIAGPTASGKSAFALALVARLQANGQGAELISVDSAQIYRGLDIGSAKPDAATRARIPHHLIDLLDPAEPYSAARFARDATDAITAIRSRGHVPILVGGTMLYFRALLHGLSELPPADAEVRNRLEAERLRVGVAGQHARLAEVDPETAARLHPNDSQRVQRALEIIEVSGEAASVWYRRAAPGAQHLGVVRRYAIEPPPRPVFDARIAARFHQMIADGFVDEVASLHRRGDLHAGLPAIRAIGYRQLWQHLDGDYDCAEAVRLGILATRHYAKRQMTWLRGEPGWTWITPHATANPYGDGEDGVDRGTIPGSAEPMAVAAVCKELMQESAFR